MALFLLVVAGCLAGGGVSIGRAIVRAHSSAPPAGVRIADRPATLRSTDGPVILFRNAIPDKSFGKLAVAPLSDPNGTRAISDLKCDRVYYARGHGLCLASVGLWPKITYVARIFDDDFKVIKEIDLTGLPSRARISGDGRYGATTVFVNGDSYAPGNFSTRTNIIDMNTDRVVFNLEVLPVTRDGKPFHNRNFNFWGVTFAHDDDHFYATLGSGASTYLVKGSIRARTLRVIHDHVECPSLSPDGTRIAYKRSLDSHGNWRLYVLDLRTMKETPLSEREPVDDQADWLDNQHVVYWRANIIWVVRADGTGRPRKLVTGAFSPAIVRAS